MGEQGGEGMTCLQCGGSIVQMSDRPVCVCPHCHTAYFEKPQKQMEKECRKKSGRKPNPPEMRIISMQHQREWKRKYMRHYRMIQRANVAFKNGKINVRETVAKRRPGYFRAAPDFPRPPVT